MSCSIVTVEVMGLSAACADWIAKIFWPRSSNQHSSGVDWVALNLLEIEEVCCMHLFEISAQYQRRCGPVEGALETEALRRFAGSIEGTRRRSESNEQGGPNS